MIENAKKTIGKDLALKLYDTSIHERQKRPDFLVPKREADLKDIGMKNFSSQLAQPWREHLEQLAEVASEISTADTVALLVMLELPALEISTLLHRLSIQLARTRRLFTSVRKTWPTIVVAAVVAAVVSWRAFNMKNASTFIWMPSPFPSTHSMKSELLKKRAMHC